MRSIRPFRMTRVPITGCAAVWMLISTIALATPIPTVAVTTARPATTLRGDLDQFAFQIEGTWTSFPQDGGDLAPYIVEQARLSGSLEDLTSPNATVTVLHFPKDAHAAWEVIFGEVATADPVATERVASSEGVLGWVWTATSARGFDVLVSFTEPDGEWALHLQSSIASREVLEVIVAAAGTFRRYDRSPQALLNLLNIERRQRDSLLRVMEGDRSFHLTSIGDRGVLVHHMGDGSWSRIEIDAWAQESAEALRAFGEIFRDGPGERPTSGVVVKLFDDRSEYQAAGGQRSFSIGHYRRDAKAILLSADHGSVAEARCTLRGLLWAWHVDVTFPEARVPRWLMYGYMSALQHTRLSPRKTPTLDARPWFAERCRSRLAARTLPTARELVTTDYMEFAANVDTTAASAESLVLYLLAVVPGDPALVARFGGRLDRAMWLALHGAEREEVAEVILGDVEGELDAAWRRWIRAQ